MKFFIETTRAKFFLHKVIRILHGGTHDMFFYLLQCVKLTYDTKVKSQSTRMHAYKAS